jgi:hypothetical protein
MHFDVTEWSLMFATLSAKRGRLLVMSSRRQGVSDRRRGFARSAWCSKTRVQGYIQGAKGSSNCAVTSTSIGDRVVHAVSSAKPSPALRNQTLSSFAEPGSHQIRHLVKSPCTLAPELPVSAYVVVRVLCSCSRERGEKEAMAREGRWRRL